MSNSPTISVVIPCYKKAQYIAETLDSVLQSDYHDYEIVIVNDGSPDNTQQIVEPYLKKNTQIRYIEQENAGVCVARNNGIAQAKGKYILPLDADDLIDKNYIKNCIEHLEANPNCGLVYTKSKTFIGSIKKAKDWYLGEYEFTKQLGMSFIYNAGVFYKSDFDKTQGYDVKMQSGLEDWEFWIQLIAIMNKSVTRLNTYGFYYRGHSDHSRTGNLNESKQQENLKEYVYQKHQALYQQYYGNLSMHVISEMAYYKYKVDRIENAIKQFMPSAIKNKIMQALGI